MSTRIWIGMAAVVLGGALDLGPGGAATLRSGGDRPTAVAGTCWSGGCLLDVQMPGLPWGGARPFVRGMPDEQRRVLEALLSERLRPVVSTQERQILSTALERGAPLNSDAFAQVRALLRDKEGELERRVAEAERARQAELERQARLEREARDAEQRARAAEERAAREQAEELARSDPAAEAERRRQEEARRIAAAEEAERRRQEEARQAAEQARLAELARQEEEERERQRLEEERRRAEAEAARVRFVFHEDPPLQPL